MIPKQAIQASLNAYLGDSAKARKKLVDALDAEFKILNDCYSDNTKIFKDAVDKIRDEQKKNDDRAYNRYKKRMGTQQGGSYSDYESDKIANKGIADDKIERAREDRDKANQSAEETYKKRFGEIYAQHKDEIKVALDKLEAEHPGAGEARQD